MPKRAKKSKRETLEVLKINPKVSKSIVAGYSELERQLEKLGVDPKPKYTLSPPLGGIPSSPLERTN